jgi:RimJ/RimL family protein N-acetyltransferase
MTGVLETARLRLREFTVGDLDPLAAMVADPEQMAFYPAVRSRAEAAEWTARNLGFYSTHGFGIWLISWRSGEDFLGYCGIRPLSFEGVDEIEIGWHVHRSVWGRGVATEAASAVRDAAFGRFGVVRLVAMIRPDHLASRRVAEKIGMRVERTAMYADEETVVYALIRE